MDERTRNLSFETLAVAADGHESDPADRSEDVVTPIHVSSTYEIDQIDPDASLEDLEPDEGEFLYSRLSNPTRNKLEHRLAALEGGEYGFAFASGTSAIATTALAVLEPGDHVVAFEDLYGGTRTMLSRLFDEHLGIEVDFVDATDPGAVRDAIRAETGLLWLETPTNPMMRLCDIEALAAIGDEYGALVAVDNTFLSPYFQQPLALGADVVVHSTTKFLNGHSDAIGGAAVTDDPELAESVGFLQQVGLGNMLAPFDAFLTLRGVKTLPVRMARHEENAMELARYLQASEQVTTVYYPGLESHPQHDLASRQMSGYGGVLSFELDADVEGVQAFLGALREFPLAVSLGGVESLIEHPASMTHSPLSQAERDHLGISDSLLRVSVGIENVDDLVADLDRGFDAIE